MAFDAITTAELAVGKPITNELMEKFKNRDDFLNAAVGTISGLGILNPSFEVDNDSDGHPDNWTETFYTGGTGAIDTATSVHGAQSYKFTHPGGAGNGGGEILSDFYPVSSNFGYKVEYAINAKGGAIPAAAVKLYDRNQSSVGTISVYGSTVPGATGEFAQFRGGFLPALSDTVTSALSSVTYARLKLIGGSTDHSTAGTIAYDDIRVTPIALSSPGLYVAHKETTSFIGTGGTSTYAVTLGHPGGFALWFSISSTVGIANNSAIFYKNGSSFYKYTLTSTNAPSSYSFSFPSTARALMRFNVNDELKVRLRQGSSLVPIYLTNIRFQTQSAGYGQFASTLGDA